jgi:hypothetical protein
MIHARRPVFEALVREGVLGLVPINIDGTEVQAITIDGETVSEVTMDGQTVFNAIPDSLETQYTFEGQSDPVVDQVGSNDGELFNSTAFNTSNARCGDVALDTSDTGSGVGYVQSQNTTDLAANGDSDGFSVAVFINSNSTPNRFATPIAWRTDGNNKLRIYYESDTNEWILQLQEGGTNVSVSSGVDAVPSSYQHLTASVSPSEAELIIDGSSVGSTSHSLNLTDIGSGSLFVNNDRGDVVEALYDNATYANGPLSTSEVNDLIKQC